MNCNLKEYKEFIDNEMLLILGQMDKATLIFDHVYLVGHSAFFSCETTFKDLLRVSRKKCFPSRDCFWRKN